MKVYRLELSDADVVKIGSLIFDELVVLGILAREAHVDGDPGKAHMLLNDGEECLELLRRIEAQTGD